MTSPHAALIVDVDPKGLESLVYGFQGADWRITACPTPETASLLVKASGAKIVIIASRADHEKAHTLIRQLRAKDATRTLPVLVLGPEELRKALKEGGDVDLLPLPAFVRDVLTASQLLVESDAAATQTPGEEPLFALPITSATTLSLIRTMCGLARSGCLQLERKGRQGEIMVHEGELTAAHVGQLQGMAAVQHTLIWNEGALKLHLRPVARRGQLHQSAHEFLEEFDRFQRDFTHAMKDIGPPATVYALSEERLQSSSNAVPAEVTPVVRLCDGQRTLSDIIDESPFRVLDTVRILGRLVDLAILVRRGPKPDPEAPGARAQLEEFWETARIVGPDAGRTPRPRGDATQSTTPPPGTPTAIPTTNLESRDGSPPLGEGTGRPRRKTLEIVTSPGSSASVAPAEVPQSPAAVPVIATSMSRPSSPIPSPVGNSATTDKLHGIGASLLGVARSPFAPVPKTSAPGAQASGIIEPRERRKQPTLRTIPERTSVLVDTAQIEIAKAPEAASPPAPQGPIAPAPAEPSAVRVTGEIQVAPSRKTARQMPAQGRMSIQLDATLAPEPESAAPPATMAAVEADPSSLRVTGELLVSPSGKSLRDAAKTERASSSFHINPSLEPSLVPSLVAETQGPARDEQAHSPDGRSPASPTEPRHQSGNFSPIERDFFEREAELYQVDKVESFADLDENRGKPAGKNGTSKKPVRPDRK